MTTRTTRHRTVRTASYTAIAVGDVAALSGFIAYGLFSHAIHPAEFPFHTVRALLPFLFAWTIAAPIGGLYRRRTIASVRSTLFRVVPVWLAVTLVGGGIRSTDVFPGESPPIFLLTTFVFGLAFVLPWRIAVALIRGRFRSAG